MNTTTWAAGVGIASVGVAALVGGCCDGGESSSATDASPSKIGAPALDSAVARSGSDDAPVRPMVGSTGSLLAVVAADRGALHVGDVVGPDRASGLEVLVDASGLSAVERIDSEQGRPAILLTLDDDAASALLSKSSAYVDRALAFVSEGRVIYVANAMSPLSRRLMVVGGDPAFTAADTDALATKLAQAVGR